MFVLPRRFSRRLTPAVGLALVFALAAGCSQVQMGYNVLSFDAAIADTANQQLLLNAVRASQHYPKSFTQPGDMKATPPVTGGIDSTFGLTRLDGLGAYGFTPKVSMDGGYSEFSLKNLNSEDFMLQIRKPVNAKVTEIFEQNRNWPEQLRDLLYIQKIQLSEQAVRLVDSKRKSICPASSIENPHRRCGKLHEHINEYIARCEHPNSPSHFVDLATRIDQIRRDRGIYFNTASNRCHYDRFRIVLEEMRLTKTLCTPQKRTDCINPDRRTPLDMIGYLGELIAAQNYIGEPFVPHVAVGIPVGADFKIEDVPLFVVQIGAPGGQASVLVMHEGVPYYIPRPDFGSPTEARSMQTLDLVLQTVQSATKSKDVPENSKTVTTIPLKKG